MQDKKKLAIFDFDGTLVYTPIPDTGRITYQEKTGNPWPHRGWWGQGDSLDTSIFEMPVNPDVIADYMREKEDSETAVIMMTGRLESLRDKVMAILKEKGLEFDGYYFNRGGSTETYKIRTINQLLKKYPNLEMVKFWDDRLSHVAIFEDWGKNHCLNGTLKDFQITVAVSPFQDGTH